MHHECYNFSGVKIGIQCEYELKCDECLISFKTEESPDFRIILKFVDTLPDAPEKWIKDEIEWHCRKSIYGGNKSELPVVYTNCTEDTCTMLTLKRYLNACCGSSVLRHLPLHHALLEFDALILHASYILVDGQAILFSAPSGTGKSTQAELWKKFRGAHIVNGDRALIRRTETGFTAGGLYYSGTSEYCDNITAPLRAIVLLGQAKSNKAEKCAGSEAFRRLFRECAYSLEYEGDPAKTANLLAELVNEIDVIKLECLPDESAIVTLENYLTGDNT